MIHVSEGLVKIDGDVLTIAEEALRVVTVLFHSLKGEEQMAYYKVLCRLITSPDSPMHDPDLFKKLGNLSVTEEVSGEDGT